MPPPARSDPQPEPHSEPVHIAPRSSSPALRRFEAKGHPLPDFYSGATGIPGRFSEGLLLRRSHCAVIPYILRLELLKLTGMWDRYPSVTEWWERMQTRPSVKAAIFDRMTEADAAPFKNFAPDLWPRVQEMLTAA